MLLFAFWYVYVYREQKGVLVQIMENQQPIRPYDCTRDFIKFYDQYYDKVYRYVYVKVGNGWDTDDIVSDIFRKAYEKYATVKRNHASWLFTIARNTIVDFYWQKKEFAAGERMKHIYKYITSFHLIV